MAHQSTPADPHHTDPAHDFTGVRVAITGGTSGLGLALVDELRARGASVAFVARTAARVAHVCATRTGIVGIVGDIADKDAIYPLALQINGLLGGLDVLINNASSLGPVPLAPLADTDCEDFEAALAANVTGPFRLTKALLGALASSARETGGALVVNISSDAAIEPYPQWGAYGASKAALRHLTRIWDAELAPQHIRLRSFDLGDMDTPLHALAVPDADPASLRSPADAAHECAGLIADELLAMRDGLRDGVHGGLCDGSCDGSCDGLHDSLCDEVRDDSHDVRDGSCTGLRGDIETGSVPKPQAPAAFATASQGVR